MKKLLSLTVALLLLSGCFTSDSNLSIIPGKKNEELIKQQQEQIDTLKQQTVALEQKNEIVTSEASKAAASVSATLDSSKFVEPPLVKEAIEEESKVALARLPEPDPAERLRALERMNLIITGQRDEALKRYAEVRKEANEMKALLEKKDSEITNLTSEIDARDATIAQLKLDAKQELAKAKIDQEAEIKRIKDEYESKERQMWILWIRIASLALVVGGAILLAVFKQFAEGGGLVAAGTIVGLVSIFVSWLTAQWWFPWLMGGIALLVLVISILAIYRLHKRKKLHEKLTAAMQDLKDESAAKNDDTWEKASEHIKYRMGDKNTGLGKEQMKVVKELGLDE